MPWHKVFGPDTRPLSRERMRALVVILGENAEVEYDWTWQTWRKRKR